MFCHSCGHEQSPTVNFCKKCGVRINQPQTEYQNEPINININLGRPFRALSILGIVGLMTLFIMYFSMYDVGARNEHLMVPFVFGAGLIAIIAIVMGYTYSRSTGTKITEQLKEQPIKRIQAPPPQESRATGQIYHPQYDATYTPVASITDDATRKMRE